MTVWLITRREIVTRLRSKVLRIATVVSVLILVGIAVTAKLTAGGPSAQDVGLTPAAEALAVQLAALQPGVRVHSVDESAGRAEVLDGSLDALVTAAGTRVDVVVKTDLPDDLRSSLRLLAQRATLDQQVRALGGDPATVDGAIAGSSVSVTALAPRRQTDPQQLALGILTSVLVYMALLLTGQAVAQGVVEEKSSRVVELLLATVRPRQLMIGKVLGLGTVGLAQVAVIAAAGLAAGLATGSLTLPAHAALGSVLWLVAWFLLGYAAYSFVFAGAASLVSRQEDVAAVITPVLMLLVIGYVVGVSVLPSHPDSALVAVMSMIPLFSPTLMPIRLALGVAPAWQVGVALAGIIAAIPLLVWVSSRVYRNAIVRGGARIRLAEAWRR
ncbi:ABC transporter permease [Hamadaea tsunoensis]|uniref:ABC transporter permease n=1 Tax=Hamadaea tsunoensis TaxID=53368 RepID=UPI0004165017|nr:ABC transporter permease [Hamadaea tsunoensis]